jgi:hypothetical protein
MCKAQWSHHTEDEATWEHEEELRANHPEGQIPSKGVGL